METEIEREQERERERCKNILLVFWALLTVFALID